MDGGMNNLLDKNGENNFLFLASVIAVLCEQSPVTVNLKDIEKFWKGEIQRLQYDLIADVDTKNGIVIFSLKEKINEN